MFPYRRALLASLGLATVLAFSATGGSLAQEDKVIATVGGETITEADLTLALADLDQQFARLPEEQKRAAALSAVIEIKLLAADAKAKGLDQSDDFKRRMAFLQQRALHSEVIGKEVEAKITDEEIRKRYDTEIATAPPANEVHARHILVKTREEAAAIVNQLDGGAKFEDIAKEKSSDAGSGTQGGDLGWFGAGQMVPEFEKAAFALEIGTYTKEPVQSQFGWHVIKLEDKRSKPLPDFAAVKPQIDQYLERKAQQDIIVALREKAKVERLDQPAAPTTPAPAEPKKP
jgi:peptidyl-prolyl cis-trans isomerase C